MRYRLLVLVCCLMSFGGSEAQRIGLDSLDNLLKTSFALRALEPKKAEAYAWQALGEAQLRKDGVRTADAYRKIAMAKRGLDPRSDSAMLYMRKAVELSASIGDLKGEQSASKNLGMWAVDRSEFAEGENWAQRSFDLAERSKDEGAMCSALVTLGNAQRRQGDLDKASGTLFKALEISRHMQDTTRTLDLLNNIGNLYHDFERSREAGIYYQLHRELAHQAERPLEEADAISNLTIVALDEEDWMKCIALADTALAMLRELGASATNMYVPLANKASACFRLGKYAESIAAVNEALHIAAGINSPSLIASPLTIKGQIAMKSHDLALADSSLTKALVASGENKSKRMEVLNALADLRELQGRLPEAKEYLEQYIETRNELISENATDQLAVAEMRQKYGTADKERKIANLTESLRLQTALRNAMIGVAVLLFLMAGLFLRNWQHNKRLRLQAQVVHEQQVNDLLKQQEIRSLESMMQGQEQERTRVAKDLHDRLGSMLSAIKLQFSAMEDRMVRMEERQDGKYTLVFGLIDEAVSEVRRISHDMVHSNLVRFGLHGALKELCAALDAPGKMHVELSVFGLAERMDPKLEIAAYRMVQEAVGNVLKHAKASDISISVTKGAAMVNIIVEDNGVGFEASAIKEGLGMGNLRERAAVFNGVVVVDSRPGHGTTVSIDLPLA